MVYYATAHFKPTPPPPPIPYLFLFFLVQLETTQYFSPKNYSNASFCKAKRPPLDPRRHSLFNSVHSSLAIWITLFISHWNNKSNQSLFPKHKIKFSFLAISFSFLFFFLMFVYIPSSISEVQMSHSSQLGTGSVLVCCNGVLSLFLLFSSLCTPLPPNSSFPCAGGNPCLLPRCSGRGQALRKRVRTSQTTRTHHSEPTVEQ